MGFRQYPLRNIGYLLRMVGVIARSRIVVIGGGGLIYDNESGQSFHKLLTEWLIRVRIAKFFGCRIVWLAVGVSVSRKHSQLLRALFTGRRTFVSVRDEKSQGILQSIGIASTIIPDPVWLITPEKPQDNTSRAAPVVGLALRHGYIPEEMRMIEEMIRFLTRKGYQIVFLSHSLHRVDAHSDDVGFVLDIARRYHIPITTSLARTFAWYPHISLLVGMRLHSLILASVHGIPMIPISYSPKTDALLDSLGIEGRIPAREFTFEAFVRAFLAVESHRDAIRFDLSRQSDIMKQKAKTCISCFWASIDGEKEAG